MLRVISLFKHFNLDLGLALLLIITAPFAAWLSVRALDDRTGSIPFTHIASTASNLTVPSTTESQAKTTLASLNTIPNCKNHSTLTVVPHQDDDILFINPRLLEAIQAGDCLRTVYVTAGDDGQSATYWQQREQAAQAAYTAMTGMSASWETNTATILGHTVHSANPIGQPQISLVYLRLPDGNLHGQGFETTNGETLQKLRNGSLSTIRSVDNETGYTQPQLIDTLRALMVLDNPVTINTQAFSTELARGDHSDHQAVGYFTTQAAYSSDFASRLHRFIGYQIAASDENLTSQQIEDKTRVFNAYEQDDRMICESEAYCHNHNVYQQLLGRQREQTIYP